MPDDGSTGRRELAVAIHAAAVAGVDPRQVTLGAVSARLGEAPGPVWIIALGKASAIMATAALDALEAHGVEPAGGVVVGTDEPPPPHPHLTGAAGDHPVPGERSAQASAAIADCVSRVRENDTAFVLLSGGATSLAAAPAAGVSERDLIQLFDGLLGSGADITVMNAIRRRFTRWGAGRLARDLAPARVHCLIVSDVVGDEIPSIGSGPCAPDPNDSAAVLALIERHGLEPYVPRPLRALLAEPSSGADAPPRPDDPVFERVECTVILGNRTALAAAEHRARELGAAPVKVVAEPLTDDATFTAQRIVDELVRFREAGLPEGDGSGAASTSNATLACMLWGGETTVRLGAGLAPAGGRCQELALAAADALRAEGDRGAGITLLAAGTDGRDGPTDAAGAVVDSTTWDAIGDAGRDPAEDLLDHRSYAALDAVGALLRTGATGTNVGDVVVGIVERPGRDSRTRG
jgi:glycerate 2-kinase